MMFDPSFLTLVAIASVCFGFLSGYIVKGLFRKQTKSDKLYNLDLALAVEAKKKKAPNRNWREAALLWRDGRNGKLAFQVEDEFYKRGADLSPTKRENLLKVVMDFQRWLDPISSAPEKEEKTVRPHQPERNWPDELVQPKRPIGKPSDIMVQSVRTQSKQVDVNPVNVLAQALRSDVKQSALPVQSMVTQVDTILQEKLELAGMKKWAIRLAELPQRGMVVLVGLEQYNGIDEVPYKPVRTIIRESVSEWEQRADTGNFLQ